jgi:hypothetical protein
LTWTPPGRDPFAVTRNSPYGAFNLILGRGLGQARERRNRHPSFV